jgi:hypothetical protein
MIAVYTVLFVSPTLFLAPMFVSTILIAPLVAVLRREGEGVGESGCR